MLSGIFNKDGMFIKKGFDPYRSYGDEFRGRIFTDDGNLREDLEQPLIDFIREKNLSPFSDAITLFYANKHGKNTNGQYPATYMWK